MAWVVKHPMGDAASVHPPAAETQPVVDSPLADLDTQLMMLAAGGDREAFSRLFQRTFKQVSGYLFRLTQDRRTAEDLTQEVFLELWNQAPRFEPRARVITWILRLATFAAIDHSRKRRRHNRPLIDLNGEALPITDAHTPAPDGQMSFDELRDQVTAAVQALPPNQQAAVILFQEQQQSYADIAEILGVTPEGVKGLLNRARETLKRQLKALL
jgi:RNA polymerase sigma-70 factor (ECF subfamily)